MPPKGSRTSKSTSSDISMATIPEPTISNSAESDSDSSIEPAQRETTLGSNPSNQTGDSIHPTINILIYM